ncbi:putative calcium-transporting ATPase 13, plasma membrane-type [Durio zibethinus]|uniref:Calcium-transporting ATPase n=1 Tax=Durio zibethinus TaxID=66656 RepID=A0A6P6A5E9_DURZI|nr:putative calcium-transporting ATPase 13, plasma membrane-type [Durio zibethinus]
MNTILRSNLLGMECIIQFPPTSKSKKKWHSIFITIRCSRTFSSLVTKSPTAVEKTNVIPRSPSHVSLTVIQENSPFQIDQTTLIELVKEKKIERLQNLDGVAAVASALGTDTELGISGSIDDIERRHKAFGSNTYKKPPTKSFFHFVIEAFKDLTIIILLGCAALSLGFGIKERGPKEGWYDGGSIFVAVFLVIAVSAMSNYRQNRQFDKLSKVSNNIQIDVVRGGRRQQFSIFDIVVGDIVCLKIGDQVPADGLFLDGQSLQIDESSMTGESDHVEVNVSQNPFLFSGTKVADGYGRMLVTSVGMNTTWGQMMSQISRDTNEQTPLQARLNKLTSSIGKVGLAVAFLVLVVLLVRYFTGNTTDENGNREFNGSKTKAHDIINAVVGIVAAAVTIIVVAIPEGLPLAVTLTLAYSMKRMMADHAMVRKLSACETMGSATTICTDKTGTLTLNRMKLTKFWLGQESMEEVASSISPYVVDLIHQGVAFNTTGSVYRASSGTEFEFSGSPTEKAILSWAVLELKMDMEKTKKSCATLQVEAFNSQKKRSGVLIGRNDDDTVHVHWKGAAEMILGMCSSYYDASGVMKDLNDSERMKFEQIIQGMAASSLRCIAFAHKQVPEEEYENLEEQKKLNEDCLTLLGLVGIKDPCRPGVKKAVEDCRYAGVNIKMITGDNVFTARAIATECGILRPGEDMPSGVVVEGEEFRNYTPQERMEKVEKIRVMSRSSPFDKLLMVQCLKKKGHVVAVTGDGTNDAPALKEADIGLSMGIQGTEVAKESSDIVILDDNFASVATVLRWGRCVYTNIQKFIQFQLTVNVAALCINFVSAVSAGEVPLTAVQLLWVNLIMDTLGALALATERPTKELMEKPPVGRTEPLITNIMWRNLLAQALYQIAVLLTLQFSGESIFGVTEKVNDTLIFNTFVLCQVFNEFNARKLEKKNVFEGIHKNKLFMGIIAITILLQVVMVEFLKRFTDTERLNWGQWGACIAIAAMSWPIGWVVKCIPVPQKPIFSYMKGRK